MASNKTSPKSAKENPKNKSARSKFARTTSEISRGSKEDSAESSVDPRVQRGPNSGRNRYDDLARAYHLIFGWSLDEGRQLMGERLKSIPVAKDGSALRVLEVGVGAGHTLPYYPDGIELVAIDRSEPLLEQARVRLKAHNRLRAQLINMDACALDFPDHSFDIVYAPSVLSVVPFPDRMLSEITRVTRVGGRAFFICFFREQRKLMRPFLPLLNPLARSWFGFRMDLSIGMLKNLPGWKFVSAKKVNRVAPIGALSTWVELERVLI